jgi:hypothetical protein
MNEPQIDQMFYDKKLAYAQEEINAIERSILQSRKDIKYIIDNINKFPSVEIPVADNCTATSCPHCGTNAYLRFPSMHKCGFCQRYYFVIVEE